jgi:hypothetical protein
VERVGRDNESSPLVQLVALALAIQEQLERKRLVFQLFSRFEIYRFKIDGLGKGKTALSNDNWKMISFLPACLQPRSTASIAACTNPLLATTFFV